VGSTSSRGRSRPQFSALANTALALGVGVLVGLATRFGQGVLPGQWNTLVNSGAIWLIPVFFVGSLARSLVWAAIAGAVTLVVTVGGYYGSAALTGAPISIRAVAFWLAMAFVAGPLYGAAGRWWHSDRRALRVFGVALLGGVLVAEGLYIVVVLRYYWSGCTMVAVGVIAAFLLARRADRLRTLLAVPLPAAAAGVVYAALDWLFQIAR
jgi:hypothetical protein